MSKLSADSHYFCAGFLNEQRLSWNESFKKKKTTVLQDVK